MVDSNIYSMQFRFVAPHSRHVCSIARFLVRLLLVHGSLSVYRLARLIKYSFYKNITLAFLLFMLQPFAGWSGEQLIPNPTP